MMRRMMDYSHGHPLKNHKILLSSDNPCSAYSQDKLITRPSPSKIFVESQYFLEEVLFCFVLSFFEKKFCFKLANLYQDSSLK